MNRFHNVPDRPEPEEVEVEEEQEYNKYLDPNWGKNKESRKKMNEFLMGIGAGKDDKTGGFEDDPDQGWCRHPEHSPPTHMVIPFGKRYRHKCPNCGAEQIIRSSQVIF